MRVFVTFFMLLTVLIAIPTPAVAHPSSHQLPFCGDEDEGTIVDACGEWSAELVPGWVIDGTRSVTFDYIHRGGTFSNALSVVQTDNDAFQFVEADGQVIDPESDPAAWRVEAVLRSETVFAGGTTSSTPDISVDLEGSWVLMLNTGSSTFFTYSAVNPNGSLQTATYRNNINPSLWQIGFEDLPGGGGDQDDLVITMLLNNGSTPPPPPPDPDPEDPVKKPKKPKKPKKATQLEYVSIGDSISSGEGGGDYSGGACHKSKNSFAAELAESLERRDGFKVNLKQLACSGDTVSDLLDSLPKKPNRSVDLVTFTIGANDLGWVDAIKTCYKFDCGSSENEQTLFDGVDLLRGTMTSTVYPRLSQAYPNADIYHVGYPHIVPEWPASENCLWLERREQLVLTNGTIYMANAFGSAAVSDARITFIPEAVTALSGREYCTDNPVVNPIEPRLSDIFGDPTDEDQERAHPTAEGYRLIADAVYGAISKDNLG